MEPSERNASTQDEAVSVSRRSVLGKVIGITAGAAAASLAAAAPAAAATGDSVKAGQKTLAEASTEVAYDGTSGFAGVVLLGNDSTYLPTDTNWPAAVAGWAGGGTSAGAGGVKVGVYGYSDAGAGYGVVGAAYGNDSESGGAGVYGKTWGAGVVGVHADAVAGATALRVDGPASFSRSGRATILKNRSYVDVAVSGGLASSANIIATLQTYRSGVWVAACRKNYPSAGKVRIYLNKVASTSSSTYVAWFVIG